MAEAVAVEVSAVAVELPLVAVAVHRLAPCRPDVSAVARDFVRCRCKASAEGERFIRANASHRLGCVLRDQWSSVRNPSVRMRSDRSVRVRSRAEISIALIVRTNSREIDPL